MRDRRNAVAVAGLLASCLGAQSLVRDINTVQGPQDSNPRFGATVGTTGPFVFAATRDDLGTEPWLTNAATAGTRLLLDIRPGPDSSNPTGFFAFGGKVYFSADDGVHGAELWATDGTAAGTMMLKDIEPGAAGGAPSDFQWLSVSGSPRLVFAAQDMRRNGRGAGRELWISDGTAAGTGLLADINPGSDSLGIPNSSDPAELTRMVGADGRERVVFRMSSYASAGSEPGVTDGTTLGTGIAWDISRSGSSNPTGFCTVWDYDVGVGGNSRVFFAADDGVHGVELWSYDGATARLEADLNPGAASSSPRLANREYFDDFRFVSVLFFTADTPTRGREPATLDRVRGLRLYNLRPGTASSMTANAELRAAPLACYFPLDDGVHGTELWQATGTLTDVRLFHEFVPGSSGADIRGLVDVGPKGLFAVVASGGQLPRVWFTDGSPTYHNFATPAGQDPNGLYFSRQLQSSPFYVYEVLFAGVGDGAVGRELFACTSQASSARLVADIQPAYLSHSTPSGFLTIGDRTFFTANDEIHGIELFVTDGTSAGTALVKDIYAGSVGSRPGNLAALGDRVLFDADDGVHGREPWISDGTPSGTFLLRDVWPGSIGSGFGHPTVLQGATPIALFQANDGVQGRELWRTDGSAAGTTLLKDIRPGPAGSGPSGLLANGGRIWFLAYTDTTGSELWRSDGSAAGTMLVKDVNPGSGSGVVSPPLVALGDGVCFQGTNGSTGMELWKSDGSAAGTVLVKDVNPGSGSGVISMETAWHGLVFFVGYDGTVGYELFRSDGTAGGTAVLRDVYPGTGGSANTVVATTDVFAYFVADDGVHGNELWRTDGTSSNTVLVADTRPGSSGSLSPSSAKIAQIGSGSRVLFVAYDDVAGEELWLSNGIPTAFPTAALQRFDLNPGIAGSSITGFARLGNDVLFGADDGVHGVELWKLPLVTAEAPLLETFGVGCPGTGGKVPKIRTPNLFPLVFSFPALAEWFPVQVTDARPASLAVMWVSVTSGAVWAGGSCTVYTDPTLLFLNTATNAEGMAQWLVGVPNDPFYLGAELYLQFAVLDPAGQFLNGVGALSDALHILVGSR